MRVLLQRVKEASVTVDGETVGAIPRGLLIFVCAEQGDSEEQSAYLAGKVARMRIFADENGKTNLAIGDIDGQTLVVSQFTLAADWRRGNRPGFSRAADPETGESLYNHFCKALEVEGVPVATGRFGAMMEVHLVNDGPFTIWMDSAEGS